MAVSCGTALASSVIAVRCTFELHDFAMTLTPNLLNFEKYS